MKLKDACSLEEKLWPTRQHIKKQRHYYFAKKGPSSQGYGFSSGDVWMWELDYKESWAPKNWCFWTVVLEKTLESPVDCKEIQPVHPKGDQSWLFIGRTDAKAETPIVWPPDVKDWLIGKILLLGKIEGRRRRGRQRMRWLDGITDLMDMSLSKHRELVRDREAWHAESIGSQRVGHDWVTKLNSTELGHRGTLRGFTFQKNHNCSCWWHGRWVEGEKGWVQVDKWGVTKFTEFSNHHGLKRGKQRN